MGRLKLRKLDASVGASGPHDFAVRCNISRPLAVDRSQVFQLALQSRCAQNAAASTASLPASVTIMIRPSGGVGCESSRCDLGQVATNIFRKIRKKTRQTGKSPHVHKPSRHCDRDRGESHDSSPPTPPYIRVRIRRFDRLSTVGVSRRAGESDSGVRRNGFGPFERRIRASPFLIAAKASVLDIRPHGRFEVSTSKRPSIVQAFSETRSAYYALC